MSSLLKFFRSIRLISVISVFFLLSLFIPQKASASPQEFVKAVQEGNNLQWYLGGASGMMATTADSLFVAIGGARDEQGKIIQAGAIQTTSTLMASLYHKPASSVEYLAYVLNNSGLTKSAFAQGNGLNFLSYPNVKDKGSTTSPILELWKSSRNVTYVFFIIIFVTIGFMIMFRSKLNPQTVVNIQLALPNIIVSLILVTFSFAICGFIIDFVYLGHSLINTVFFQPDSTPLARLIDVQSGNSYYPGIVEKVDIVSSLLYPNNPGAAIPSAWAGVNVFDQFLEFISLSNMFEMGRKLLGNEGGSFFADLMPLIMVFVLLGTGLKIFFSLITKYVTLILSTIFSPFVFLMSALPGKSEGIGNFLKTMLSAALTFPAVSFMFFLSGYFVEKAKIGLVLSALPPLNKTGLLESLSLGTTAAGVVNTTDRVLEPLIALGILMATTQVSQAIDQALGVKAGIAGAATPDIGSALSKIPVIGGLLH